MGMLHSAFGRRVDGNEPWGPGRGATRVTRPSCRVVKKKGKARCLALVGRFAWLARENSRPGERGDHFTRCSAALLVVLTFATP